MLREARLATPALSQDASVDFLCRLELEGAVSSFVVSVDPLSNPPFLCRAGGECCDFEISFFIQEEASFRAISVGRFFIVFLSILSSIYFLQKVNFEQLSYNLVYLIFQNYPYWLNIFFCFL